ncbi:MAG TPA: hypothetical protein VFE53_02340 [Mucilaginibacter sp.]|jgi:hypothetical protein|nr:hypothetical protein [Mucilaginibacter sp.]
MDNLFNINRFGRLFIKHTAERFKTYLMSLAVLVGVLVLGGSFMVYIIDEPIELNAQTAMFGGFYFLAGAMFTSTVFADFGDKRKAITSLTLPASNFEKFLVGWVWSYLLFSIVFIATFYLVLFSFMHLRHLPNQRDEVFNIFAQPAIILFIPFSFVNAFTLFGAIYFNKLHFIKTGFVFFISLAVLVVANTIFLQSLLGQSIRPAMPFTNVSFNQNNNFYDINLVSNYDWLVCWLIIAASILLWVAAYFRLKEKQV